MILYKRSQDCGKKTEVGKPWFLGHAEESRYEVRKLWTLCKHYTPAEEKSFYDSDYYINLSFYSNRHIKGEVF